MRGFNDDRNGNGNRRRLSLRQRQTTIANNQTSTRNNDTEYNRTSNPSSLFASQSHRRRRRRRLFAGIQLERTTYKLPDAIERKLIDLDVAIPTTVPAGEGTEKELPIFWHVLKSGGTTMKLMYAQCYHLVEACETGELIDADPNQQQTAQQQQQQQQQPEPSATAVGQAPPDQPSPWDWMQQHQQAQLMNLNTGQQRRLQTAGQDDDQQLRIVTSEDGRKYVNVDITTPEGILRASQRGFASSSLADVAFTPLLTESAEFLLRENSGRMFAVFRHPVERVVSIFHYLQTATWEPTYNPEYATWTIDDYVGSPYCESNWMVRSLTGKMTGPLSGDDLGIAKEALRRKCLVGLMEGMDESVLRFHSFFGFGDEAALGCAREHFSRKGSGANSNGHPALDQASDTWAELARKNGLDILLYEYAQQLFKEQGEWLKKERMI